MVYTYINSQVIVVRIIFKLFESCVRGICDETRKRWMARTTHASAADPAVLSSQSCGATVTSRCLCQCRQAEALLDDQAHIYDRRTWQGESQQHHM